MRFSLRTVLLVLVALGVVFGLFRAALVVREAYSLVARFELPKQRQIVLRRENTEEWNRTIHCTILENGKILVPKTFCDIEANRQQLAEENYEVVLSPNGDMVMARRVGRDAPYRNRDHPELNHVVFIYDFETDTFATHGESDLIKVFRRGWPNLPDG